MNPRKVYPADPGLIPVFDRSGRSHIGHALETAVFIELQRRQAEVAYWNFSCLFPLSPDPSISSPSGNGCSAMKKTESRRRKALAIALEERGLSCRVPHPIRVMFRGKSVGDFFADILVQGK